MNRKLPLVAAVLVSLASLGTPLAASAESSVAREWNEALLNAIRKDYARPTVHARNLFHTSVAMYDAWAAYDDVADPFLLGRTVGGYTCPFVGVRRPADVAAARKEAISYAAYRLLTHRFQHSPGLDETQPRFDALFAEMGYDPGYVSTDYVNGPPAALGNYIARSLIAFGFRDGANEEGQYANRYYEPVNPTLIPYIPGNPDIVDPNRWQPLTLDVFIDQSGHVIPRKTPEFLSPEWGAVVPFSLSRRTPTVYRRDGFDYLVYHDPGPPPQIGGTLSDEYKWGYSLVAIWSSHLDPSDRVMWDCSPGSVGNIPQLPTSFPEYRNFYNLFEGGDPSQGHTMNPVTGKPYAPNPVPRGDYCRVLAEFWADGPDSETPPGHWFTILNYVNDHPLFERRYEGQGPVLDPLEWDVKAYLTLGGAVHDVAVDSWGIKGRYDSIRPISAIRYMADRGQSSDPSLPRYDPDGLPLIEGYIELIEPGDLLAASRDDPEAHVGKVKIKAWRGPSYIDDPERDVAGVDWIRAENWWPYQRPSFVTPPFAGYISGHSTYSRAAAVVLSRLTGSEYFPGGMGVFEAPKNEFLVFEEGPSVDVTLQWAKYEDASDQCSLSRIWGGIHPPADDVPGRIIGEEIGNEAFELARAYFRGEVEPSPKPPLAAVFPNPVIGGGPLHLELSRPASRVTVEVFDVAGRLLRTEAVEVEGLRPAGSFPLENLHSGVYFLRVSGDGWTASQQLRVLR